LINQKENTHQRPGLVPGLFFISRVLKGVKKGEKKSAGFQSYETLLKGQ
jgi:hypothetical protein